MEAEKTFLLSGQIALLSLSSLALLPLDPDERVQGAQQPPAFPTFYAAHPPLLYLVNAVLLI
jgi:hypothetical protein